VCIGRRRKETIAKCDDEKRTKMLRVMLVIFSACKRPHWERRSIGDCGGLNGKNKLSRYRFHLRTAMMEIRIQNAFSCYRILMISQF